MSLKWTGKAYADLERLHEFLALANKRAATKAIQKLVSAADILLTNPRVGEQLFQFEQREVRRLLVGNYEIRYELREDAVHILRLWHTREDR